MKNAIACGLTYGVVTFLVAWLMFALLGNVDFYLLSGMFVGTALWNFGRELRHQKRIEKLLKK